MCGGETLTDLCSCSCCSKLRGVSLQKSWQLAGLLAKTLAFWAEDRLRLRSVAHDDYHGNRFKLFHHHCITILQFLMSVTVERKTGLHLHLHLNQTCISLLIIEQSQWGVQVVLDCTCSLWVRYCVSKLCLRDNRGGCGPPWYKASPSCCLDASPLDQQQTALKQGPWIRECMNVDTCFLGPLSRRLIKPCQTLGVSNWIIPAVSRPSEWSARCLFLNGMYPRDYTVAKWTESKLKGWWGHSIITDKDMHYCIIRWTKAKQLNLICFYIWFGGFSCLDEWRECIVLCTCVVVFMCDCSLGSTEFQSLQQSSLTESTMAEFTGYKPQGMGDSKQTGGASLSRIHNKLGICFFSGQDEGADSKRSEAQNRFRERLSEVCVHVEGWPPGGCASGAVVPQGPWQLLPRIPSAPQASGLCLAPGCLWSSPSSGDAAEMQPDLRE